MKSRLNSHSSDFFEKGMMLRGLLTNQGENSKRQVHRD